MTGVTSLVTRDKPDSEVLSSDIMSLMMEGTHGSIKMKSFSEFWPFYVRVHSHPFNRRLHFTGTGLVIVCFLWGVFTLNPLCFALMPLFGYGFAWIGHFTVEKNTPAAFQYPVWSLIADFKMFGLIATGKMDDEIKRIG